MKQIESPFVCQICGARLRLTRKCVNEVVVEITELGNTLEIVSPNNVTHVYCTYDSMHKVGDDQRDEIITIAEESGY